MSKDKDHGKGPAAEDKNFFIFVDGEKWEPPAREMAPNDIIAQASPLDPSTHYLRKRHGRDETSYKDIGGTRIVLEKADRFEIISVGATPVS